MPKVNGDYRPISPNITVTILT